MQCSLQDLHCSINDRLMRPLQLHGGHQRFICVVHAARLPCCAVSCGCAATVLRDGKRISIDADQLVPGDVVFIKSGDKVPADLRMLQVTNLQVSSSSRRRRDSISRQHLQHLL